jgi:hypothetical protein
MERQRAVKSVESEGKTLNDKAALQGPVWSATQDQSGEDPFLMIIRRPAEEMNFLDGEARPMADKCKDATARAWNLERATKRVEQETHDAKELLSLVEASLANQSVEIDSKETWRELGVDSAVRENS